MSQKWVGISDFFSICDPLDPNTATANCDATREEDGNLDMMNEDGLSEDIPGHQLRSTVDAPGPATVEGLALEELDERSNGYLVSPPPLIIVVIYHKQLEPLF